MVLPDHTKLKNVGNVALDGLSNRLEVNLKAFFDWAMLSTQGAWQNVGIPTSGAYGGDFAQLRLVDDPNFTAGQVWQTIRKDLVYETGVNYELNSVTYNPTQISGVWVDSTFYGPDDATYGHYVNHPLGQVVFDSAISTTATVEMNYSHRWTQIYRADDAPWLQELQYGSYRPDDEHFEYTGTGIYSQFASQRIQLPAIILEVTPRRRSEGQQLGHGGLRVYQDVTFWVLAETRWERNNLFDLIANQEDKTIWLFNTNDATSSYPLDFNGDRTSDIMYPDLVSETGFRWQKCRFSQTRGVEVRSMNPYLHMAQVRVECEINVDNAY